ncbi:MAG: hypothetical protein PVG66_11015 [Chromatiales bacterium]|jgi:hypothetical protein
MQQAKQIFPAKAPLFLAVLLSLLAGGCSTTGENRTPHTLANNIATVQINQPITIPAGRTRVFIQHGKITQRFNHYAPNCNIEVRKLDNDNDQTVAPGTYQVTRVRDTLEEVVQFRPGNDVTVAFDGKLTADQFRLMAIADDDSGTSSIYRGYHFRLQGDDANVLRLSCRGVLAYPADALPPSYEEIVAALGELISVAR